MANGGKRAGAGRPKGAKNKVSEEIREDFAFFLSYASPKIVELWDKVAQDDPKDALKAINDFADFVLPKLTRTDIQALDKDGEKANLSLNVTIEK